MNLVELAVQHYRNFGEQVSLIFEDQEYKNVQLLRYSEQLAHGLKGLDVKMGDRVMVMLMNSPEVLISYQGILRAGGIIVPVINFLGEREMIHILRNSESKVLITNRNLMSKIEKGRADIETLKQIIVVENEDIPGTVNFWNLVRTSSEEPNNIEIDEYDLAVILYTAGTTG